MRSSVFFFFQAEDGIRDWSVTGVQTCALPILLDRLLRVERSLSPCDPLDEEPGLFVNQNRHNDSKTSRTERFKRTEWRWRLASHPQTCYEACSESTSSGLNRRGTWPCLPGCPKRRPACPGTHPLRFPSRRRHTTRTTRRGR